MTVINMIYNLIATMVQLAKWTQNDRLYDTSSDVYLPSLGGTTA